MSSSFWSGGFYFDGIHSDDYNVCIVDFNNSDILKEYSVNYTLDLEKEISANNTPFYKKSDRSSNEVVLELARTDGKPWTINGLLSLNNWLFKNEFKPFQSMDLIDDNIKLIYYLKAIGINKKINKDMYGIVSVTFQSYEPYGYIVPSNNTVINGGASGTINNYSNIGENYKPKIKITSTGGTSVKIKNTSISNDKYLQLDNLKNGDVIIVDNLMGTIQDVNKTNRFELLNLNNLKFVELLQGINTIQVEGSNIKTEWLCEFPIIL